MEHVRLRVYKTEELAHRQKRQTRTYSHLYESMHKGAPRTFSGSSFSLILVSNKCRYVNWQTHDSVKSLKGNIALIKLAALLAGSRLSLSSRWTKK